MIIEPDPELRQILVAEVEEATGIKVTGVDPGECEVSNVLTGAVPLVFYSNYEQVRARLSPETDLIVLHSPSVSESLHGQKKPEPDAITVVVSHWPEFLRSSRTVLVAAGLHPDSLSFRDARERGWKVGLRSASLVITDSLTAGKLPAIGDVRIFRVISDSSIAETPFLCETVSQVSSRCPNGATAPSPGLPFRLRWELVRKDISTATRLRHLRLRHLSFHYQA